MYMHQPGAKGGDEEQEEERRGNPMSDAHIFPRSDMLKIQEGIATLHPG